MVKKYLFQPIQPPLKRKVVHPYIQYAKRCRKNGNTQSNFSTYDGSKADMTADESLTNRHERRNDRGIFLID